MTSSKSFRSFAALLLLTSLRVSPAEAAEPCTEFKRALDNVDPRRSAQELRNTQTNLERLLAACAADPSSRSGPNFELIHVGRGVTVRLTTQIAMALHATTAAPEKAEAAAPHKRGGKSPPAASGLVPGQSKPAIATPPAPPGQEPANKPRRDDGAEQARLAIRRAEEYWRQCREELNGARDPAQRKVLTPFYISAAMAYLEPLILWDSPQERVYSEILAPLIADGDARAALQVAASRARIERLWRDPERSKALERYIQTSIDLGRQVSPERTKALEKAVAKDFSEETLDELVRVWGHEQGEELVRELSALATVSERIEAETRAKKQLVLLVATPFGDVSPCAKEFAKQLKEDLELLYPTRMQIVDYTMKPGEATADVDGRLKQELQNARAQRGALCDGAIGVTIRESTKDQLEIDGKLLLAGAEVFQVKNLPKVSCEGKTSGLQIAGGVFRALLEQVVVKHKDAAIFGTDAIQVGMTRAGTSEPVPFACGTFQRRLQKETRTGILAIHNECDPETARGLQAVMTQLGYKTALREPAVGEPVLILHRSPSVAQLPERCEASLQADGEEYLHFWAGVLASNQPDEESLERSRNAKTGDRLALCLASYYLAPAPVPPEYPRASRPPLWVPALLAPGLPLLMDDKRGNDWLGYTWMGADALALAGSVGFAFLAIDRRNAAAESTNHNLNTANAYLNVSLISGAVFLASHLTSTLVFGRGDKSTVQVGTTRPDTLFTW